MKYIDFKTAPYLSSGHMQTLWGVYFRSYTIPQREIYSIPLRDHYALSAHVQMPKETLKGVCLLWHGLTGSSSAHYIVELEKSLLAQGIGCISVNHRGALGPECPAFLGPSLYHAGVLSDLQDCVIWAKAFAPQVPLFGIGFSLSGNMLLRALGYRALPDLTAAIAVSVPFDLAATADQVDKNIGRLYQKYLLGRMKQVILTQQLKANNPWDAQIKKALKTRSFWAFDDAIIAPMHGFRNVHDYYREASSGQYIGMIEQPTLIIQSADDPLVPVSAWPRASQFKANIQFEAYNRGGHVGFIGQDGYLLDQRVPDFFRLFVRQ